MSLLGFWKVIHDFFYKFISSLFNLLFNYFFYFFSIME